MREACRSTGKEATLQLDGEDVFLDRTLLEAIKTPLLHVVRNAVDHGIEPVEVREGRWQTRRRTAPHQHRAARRQVELTVTDDGRRLDVGCGFAKWHSSADC